MRGKKINIMHVDDEEPFLDLTKIYLEKIDSNLDITMVTDPLRGLQLLETHDYDVVVCDYQMPSMNGLELLAKLRKQGNTIPFIILTGRGREEVAIQALNLGADYYLQKSTKSKVLFAELYHFISRAVERKRAGNKIRRHEQRLRDLFETMTEGVVFITPDGQIIEANSAACRILGLTRSEIKDRNYVAPEWDIIRPDGSPMPSEELAGPRAMSEKRPVKDIVMGVRRPDTSTSWIHVNAAPLVNEANELEGVVGTFTDITGRKKAEETLIESDEKLRNLIAAVPVAISITTPKGEILEANSAAWKMFNYDSKEDFLQAKAPIFWNDPTDRERFVTLLNRGTVKDFEATFKRNNGSVFRASLTSTMQATKNGVQIVNSFQDITERKKMEESLKKSEEKFAKAFHSSPNSIAITRMADGYIVDVNDSFIRTYGYTREELVDRSVLDLNIWVNPKKRPEFIKALQEHEEVRNFDVQVRAKSGEIRTMLFSTEMIDLDGEACMITTASDITERNRAVNALRERESDLAEFKELFSNVLDNTSAHVYMKDLESNYTYINKGTEEYFNIKNENIAGKTDYDFFSREKAEQIKARDREIIEKGIHLQYEEKITGEGPDRYFLTQKFPLRDDNDKIFGICGISTDMGKEKQAEEKLKESEERYRNLFDESPVSLVVEDYSKIKEYFNSLRQSGINDFRKHLDENPEVVKKCAKMVIVNDVNQAALNLYEAKNKEEFSSGLNKFFGEESYGAFKEYIIALIEGKTSFEHENVNLTLKGEKKNVYIRISVIPGHEETLSRALVSTIDITERKKAEEELTKFKAISDFAGHGIGMISLDGYLIYINEAFARMHGYTREELAGKHFSILHDEKQMETVEKLREQLEQEDIYIAEEVWHKRKDGTVFPTLMNGTAVRDDAGKLLYLSATAIDITEQKGAEEALQESEELFKSLSESTMVGILIIQEDELKYANEALARISGYTRKEMENWTASDILGMIHPEDRAFAAEQLQKKQTGIKEGVVQHLSIRMITRRKEINWVEIYSGTILYKGKTADFVTVIDITERMIMEKAVQESEERFRGVVENTRAGYFYIDHEGRFQDVNDAWMRIHGYISREEVIGQHFSLTQVDVDMEQAQKSVEALLGGKVFPTGEFSRRCKDGSIGYHSFSAHPVTREGKVVGFEGFIIDTTEQKKIEEELLKQREELSQFASTMAHDVNNSLVIIDGYAELLVEEQDKSHVDVILEQSRYMKNLLRRSLALAEAGLVIDKKDRVDLDQLVDEVAAVSIPESIDFSRDDLPVVTCDRAKIKQAFKNLLENAMIHGKPTKIEVKHEVSEKGAIIAIVNDGKPIPPEIRDRVFDRGFSTREGSSGLGLVIVERLVEAHGWKITLQPTEKTTFQVVIPDVVPGK
ncbi:MAG: PAS domain S-box protein [Candidatus Hodarchaeales archaeon]